MAFPSLKPEHLKRYKDLARLLMKYGGNEFMRTMPIDEAILREQAGGVVETKSDTSPEAFTRELEKLGPTYIKIGQVLSSRPDLLPLPYIRALSRLQDDVEPFSFSEAEDIVSTELGVKISKAFQVFEVRPLAAASLGQVHLATLRDGTRVAVKIQRPGIREIIFQDLEAFQHIAEFMEDHTDTGKRFAIRELVEEFRRTLLRELDYRQEAQNLKILRQQLQRFRNLVVPAPVDDYTTSRVLTMEYIEGVKLTELSPVAQLELNGPQLMEELADGYLEQIMIHGTFHADPHPGNIFLTLDNQLALLDLGMVAHLGQPTQEKLMKMLVAISEGHGQDAAEQLLIMGTKLDDFDQRRFTREIVDLVARSHRASIDQIKMGDVLMEMARIGVTTGFRSPSEMATVGKTLFQLDEIARVLAPKWNPNEFIRQRTAALMQRRIMSSLSPRHLFQSALELQQFLQKLPARLNQLMDSLGEGKVEVRLRAMNETRLMNNLQKIANRIAMGLILAAMIIGAALLMRVETEFMLFGYPGLAIILFILATAGGIALIVSMYVDTERIRDRKRRKHLIR